MVSILCTLVLGWFILNKCNKTLTEAKANLKSVIDKEIKYKVSIKKLHDQTLQQIHTTTKAREQELTSLSLTVTSIATYSLSVLKSMEYTYGKCYPEQNEDKKELETILEILRKDNTFNGHITPSNLKQFPEISKTAPIYNLFNFEKLN